MTKLISLLVCFCIFQHAAHANCTLPAPEELKSEKITRCQFGLTWNAVAGATNYNIQYKLSTDVNWTVLNNIGLVTSYTFTGILASSTYKVKVAAVCSNGEVGSYTGTLSVKTPSCSIPGDLAISNLTAYSVTVSWSAVCGESEFKLQYQEITASTWVTFNNIFSTSFALGNLTPNTSYNVRLQASCGNGNSKYDTITFTTPNVEFGISGKNVLLVIVDDARFDSYIANGAPDFVNDTNISRIAKEGVNFKLTFPAQSQCAPSRASMLTGVYPHLHGIENNPNNDNVGLNDTITLITLPQILQNNGYYCGLIGKYHISSNPQPGYNYWMENHKIQYIDAKYNVNGNNKKILGHQSDVLTDSAIGFFHKVPAGKPFFLWLGYRAPHTPYDEPRPVDDGIYDNETMPFPSNNERYDVNYPEFLYHCHNAHDSAILIEEYRGYYELLHGVEVNLGRVWNELETLGLMDSTLIIFISDNGYMMGEHDLSEKQLAYEESIKLPLFMRYPKLLQAGRLVRKQMAMNIDISPTILDFAGIADTFGMQGISLLKMVKGQASRKEFLYEWNHQDCVPDMRAVRSLTSKYVQYYCSDTTEEFFDLKLDKHENTNEIFNPAYADSVLLYRGKMAFWRNYYQDYSYDTLYTCSLSNIQQKMVSEGNEPVTLLDVFPNPSSDHFTIHFMSAENAISTVRIVNMVGNILYEETWDEQQEIIKTISTAEMPPGSYFAIVQHGLHTFHKSFVVQ